MKNYLIFLMLSFNCLCKSQIEEFTEESFNKIKKEFIGTSYSDFKDTPNLIFDAFRKGSNKFYASYDNKYFSFDSEQEAGSIQKQCHEEMKIKSQITYINWYWLGKLKNRSCIIL